MSLLNSQIRVITKNLKHRADCVRHFVLPAPRDFYLTWFFAVELCYVNLYCKLVNKRHLIYTVLHTFVSQQSKLVCVTDIVRWFIVMVHMTIVLALCESFSFRLIGGGVATSLLDVNFKRYWIICLPGASHVRVQCRFPINTQCAVSYIVDVYTCTYLTLVAWCTKSLTFNSCTLCLHYIYAFCIYLRTNSDLCHLYYKLIGFYNLGEKCLLRGTNWVFK
jgi:hypothetical protein